jgi:hypothetical protein
MSYASGFQETNILQKVRLHSAFLSPINAADLDIDLTEDEVDRIVENRSPEELSRAVEKLTAFAKELKNKEMVVRVTVEGRRSAPEYAPPLTRECVIEARLSNNREFWVGLSHALDDWKKNNDPQSYWRHNMSTLGAVKIAANVFFDDAPAADLENIKTVMLKYQDAAKQYKTPQITEALSKCFNVEVAYAYKASGEPAAGGYDVFYIDSEPVSKALAESAAEKINEFCAAYHLEGVKAGTTYNSEGYQVDFKVNQYRLSSVFDSLARQTIDVSEIMTEALNAANKEKQITETRRKSWWSFLKLG